MSRSFCSSLATLAALLLACNLDHAGNKDTLDPVTPFDAGGAHDGGASSEPTDAGRHASHDAALDAGHDDAAVDGGHDGGHAPLPRDGGPDAGCTADDT